MKCDSCYFRGSVPGDRHSCCRFPGTKSDLFDFMSPDNGVMMEVLNITIDPHGFSKGWAFWPVNFDPIWIRQCWGFLNRESPVEDNKRFEKWVKVYRDMLKDLDDDLKTEFQAIIENLEKALAITVQEKGREVIKNER